MISDNEWTIKCSIQIMILAQNSVYVYVCVCVCAVKESQELYVLLNVVAKSLPK